jgi:cyclopropane-fatty-acyl-phospholipid synthase
VRDRSSRGFDGPRFAFLSWAVRPPRDDDLHDRERAKFTCGDGTGKPVAVRFLTTEAERRVLLNPELAFGESYMEGKFVVENALIADAPAILHPRGRKPMSRAIAISMAGSIRCSSTPTSCAYFETPDATLDDAQLAKKRHLAAKLKIERGHRWKIIAISLARSIASSRWACSNTSGVDFYETFFRRCAELVTDDGVMILHSIGRSQGPTSPARGSPNIFTRAATFRRCRR